MFLFIPLTPQRELSSKTEENINIFFSEDHCNYIIFYQYTNVSYADFLFTGLYNIR